MKKVFLTVVTLIIFSTFVYAQVDRSQMPKPAPAPEIHIGDYESFQLDNGLNVFVVENHKLPRIAIQLVIDRDPISEGDKAGYISAAGQLLRTGTLSRTKDRLDEEIDFIGANISTSPTNVFASGLSKHTEKIMELMSDIVLHPNFTQEEFDKIKKQMISGLAAEKEEPNAIMNKVRRAILFGKKHPYGEITTEETVSHFNLDDCKNYYSTYFKPNISYVALVGDIDVSTAKELMTKYFSDWQKGTVPSHKVKNVRAPLVRKVEIVDRPNAVQSIVSLAYPVKLKKGSKEEITASVLNTAFGGTATARLFMNLREDKGYTYGAYSTLSADEYIGTFYTTAQVRNAVTDSSVQEFLNEMKKIRQEGITEEELNDAKKLLTGRFSRSLEKPQTIANFAINIARYGLEKDYYKKYLKNLSAVTLDEVKNAAKKFIKPNNAHVIVVGNADEIADGLKKFSVSGRIDFLDTYANPVDMAAKKLPADLTVDKVINKYIEVTGGRDALSSLQDVTMTMSGQVQGMDVLITIKRKAPNKYYFNMDIGNGMMTQTQKFDGVKAKSSGMGQERELTGDELEEMKVSAVLNEFLDYGKYGITPELTGMEKVNGKDSYKVTLTLPSGKKKTEYYDAQSGFKVKEMQVLNTPQGQSTMSTEYSDYKSVNGILFPFRVVQQIGPMTIDMKVTSVEINKGLDDSFFDVK